MKSKKIIGIVAILVVIALVFAGSASAAVTPSQIYYPNDGKISVNDVISKTTSSLLPADLTSTRTTEVSVYNLAEVSALLKSDNTNTAKLNTIGNLNVFPVFMVKLNNLCNTSEASLLGNMNLAQLQNLAFLSDGSSFVCPVRLTDELAGSVDSIKLLNSNTLQNLIANKEVTDESSLYEDIQKLQINLPSDDNSNVISSNSTSENTQIQTADRTEITDTKKESNASSTAKKIKKYGSRFDLPGFLSDKVMEVLDR